MSVVARLGPYPITCLLSLFLLYIYVYICVSVREAMTSYFISSPGGLSDVCLEKGRVMTSILLLFIKMELVYRNAVSRQTVIDIKCRQVRQLCVAVLCIVVIRILTPCRAETSPGCPSWGHEFDLGAVYVGVLVDEVALREDYLRVRRSSPVSIISATLHTHL